MCLERLDGPGQSAQGLVVGAAGVRGGLDRHGAHDVDDLVDVIEDDDLVVEAEVEVREVAVIGRGAAPRELVGLGVADRVVGGVADPAADHAGGQDGAGASLRDDGRPVRGGLAHDAERVVGRALPGGRRAVAPIADRHAVAPGDDLDQRVGAEDGVAPLAVAVLDGLEEEGRRGAFVLDDEAPVGEDGGELIGEEAHRDRDHRRRPPHSTRCALRALRTPVVRRAPPIPPSPSPGGLRAPAPGGRDELLAGDAGAEVGAGAGGGLGHADRESSSGVRRDGADAGRLIVWPTVRPPWTSPGWR